MKEELYQKEIKDLTQDELYEILIDCCISSVKKVEPGQGGISFLEDLQSKEEKIEMENQTALIYYGILDKLEILKDINILLYNDVFYLKIQKYLLTYKND